MRIIFLLLVLTGIQTSLPAQMDTSLRSMTARETELYNQIMKYRSQKRLDKIAVSPSMTKVAQCHVRDLNENTPSDKCGMHSWSSKGVWKAVCYNTDKNAAKLMWSKPAELTPYTGNGYEIAFWTTDTAFTAEDALTSWKTSPSHNAVIINLGVWKDSDWKAIGIATEGNYAVVWFGDMSDPVKAAITTE
jgi:hypothetical protein